MWSLFFFSSFLSFSFSCQKTLLFLSGCVYFFYLHICRQKYKASQNKESIITTMTPCAFHLDTPSYRQQKVKYKKTKWWNKRTFSLLRKIVLLLVRKSENSKTSIIKINKETAYNSHFSTNIFLIFLELIVARNRAKWMLRRLCYTYLPRRWRVLNSWKISIQNMMI